MTTANLLFKSSISRTSLTILSIIISFLMLPFLVSKLGDEWYGIWTVLGSLIGYYYLVDFGLATAVTRYITQYISKNDKDNANSVINTALVIYSAMALAICFITITVGYFVHYFVPNARDLLIIRIAIFIMGFNLAIEFPFKAFAGIIGAYVRYDLITYAHIFTLLLSTALIVILMNLGYGIIALSVIGFICSQISNIIFYFISKHLFSDMQISRKFFRKDKVKELFGYSVWSFLIQIADQMRFRIDSVVIAWMLTAAHVTHYFIGARLAEYFLTFLYRATNILMPVFTKYHAENNYQEIRAKLLFMTKINNVLSLFGGGLILIVGMPFISKWMGDSYLDAYPVLVVLIIAVIVEAVHNPSNNVLFAIAKHRYIAIVGIFEAIINFILSLVLIQYYGILGVAIGTAIPLIISRLFILPLYTCRCIGLPLTQYYSNLFVTTLFTIIYLGLFYMLVKDIIIPQYMTIVVACLSAVPIYLFSILFVSFNRSERILLRSLLPSKLY